MTIFAGIVIFLILMAICVAVAFKAEGNPKPEDVHYSYTSEDKPKDTPEYKHVTNDMYHRHISLINGMLKNPEAKLIRQSENSITIFYCEVESGYVLFDIEEDKEKINIFYRLKKNDTDSIVTDTIISGKNWTFSTKWYSEKRILKKVLSDPCLPIKNS